MKPTPPKGALRFLRWFCREDYLEEIEGDLTELYEGHYDTSPFKAKWKFAGNVMRYFRPSFIKSFKTNPHLNPIAMFRHNFLMTYRSFKRYKRLFLINLFGLSTGMACALLIFLWVDNEMNIDKFFEKDDQLFQVMQNLHHTHGVETIEATPVPLAKGLAEEMPEIAFSVAVVPPTFNISKGVIAVEDTRVKATGQYVSGDFFNTFSYRLIRGNKNKILSNKNEVVISKALALKLFNSTESAIGKTINWKARDINRLCLVSGIFESPPSTATNHFDLLLSYELFQEINPGAGWGDSSPRTYVLLKPGTSIGQFNDKIGSFLKTKDKNSKATLFLQRYSDRYLYGLYENGVPAGGRIEYVRLFSIIAIFILLVACINFMSLSTARSLRKIKEVGIKKVVGARRGTLMMQYMGESVLMAFLSLVVAMLLVVLFLPHFNLVTGKQLSLNFDADLILVLLAITLFAGIVSGSYPALYISSFKPASTLKGRLDSSLGAIWARKGLVIFQFAVAVVLIVSVWVVYEQVKFVQSENLGYDRDHVIYFDTDNVNEDFMFKIRSIPGVLNAGGGNMVAGKPLGGTNGIHWEGKDQGDAPFFSRLWAGYNLIETLGMEMVAGQAFSEDFGSHNQIIFNETAIERMALKDPIGKMVKIDNSEMQIVGVAKDFHFESLYEEIKPCVIFLAPIIYAPKVSVKIRAGTENETIDKLRRIYQTHSPEEVFDFKFMDDDYQRLYASEKRVAILSRYFAGLAIVISGLGLFGLLAFTVEKRLKEIGIRKILGATDLGIIRLLSGDLTRMVLIAIIIALPLSYLIVTKWLDDFAYRIDLKWWYFIGAGLLTMLVAWLTVGTQMLKTVRINPAASLKNE
ncbi:ABC transporter permease [Agaribacillus aureus]